MRKIFFNLCLILMGSIGLSACDKDLPFLYRPDPESDRIVKVQRNWETRHVIFLDGNQITDLTSFFEDFQVKIEFLRSTCCIMGCETWIAAGERRKNCTTFKNTLTGNSMTWLIQEIPEDDAPVITVFVEKDNPGFSFLPSEISVESYLLSLTRK